MWLLRYLLQSILDLLRSLIGPRRRPSWNVISYTFTCERDRVLYIGITNNPRASDAELGLHC